MQWFIILKIEHLQHETYFHKIKKPETVPQRLHFLSLLMISEQNIQLSFSIIQTTR